MTALSKPPHPGSILKNDVLPELGVSITEAAVQLGVSRVTLSRAINGEAPISLDLALRLGAWLKNLTAEYWLHLQTNYNLWQERQKPRPDIKPAEWKQPNIKMWRKFSAQVNSASASLVIDKEERAIAASVGSKLKEARKFRGQTIAEASQLLDIPAHDLKFYEGGLDIEHFPLKLIKKSAAIYDVSVDWIFGLVEDDWESDPKEVRDEHVELDFIKYLLMERQRAMERQLWHVGSMAVAMTKPVSSMTQAYKKVHKAFMNFLELNPKFDDMRGGATLSKEIKQAVKNCEAANRLLERVEELRPMTLYRKMIQPVKFINL
ncbi:HigA family addiction module antitoxin [Nitrosomonas communis]|uniref:Addiction module antidote protein, HigA family n=1 Tax=Nitrosomonas communis TaxID=44574 RepID=A0A1I4V3T7_9PROT|nr:HigA family addiction module antitoxin [Nitrosomonas communis]SFM95783.1 addiction module antidote protein, HigA family [Nitrosomonas communis]